MDRIFSPKALIAARARARFTLKVLGDRTGLSFQQINRYEKKRVTPRDTTVVLLADALGVDPDSLYIEQWLYQVEDRFYKLERLDNEINMKLIKAEKNKQSILASAFSRQLANSHDGHNWANSKSR